MSRKGVMCVAGLLALCTGGSACSGAGAEGGSSESSQGALQAAPAPRPLPVPTLPGDSCPTSSAILFGGTIGSGSSAIAVKGTSVTGYWAAAPLFAAATSPGLAGYWAYTWNGAANADFAALSAYAASVGATMQRDCTSVTALSSVTDSVWTTMRAKNGERTSKLAALPSSPASAPVRVAVIDSAATAYASTTSDTFDHGRAVGRAIRELSCPNEFGAAGGIASNFAPHDLSSNPISPIGGVTGPCIGQISNFAALVQLTATTTNTTLGGYFGTESELAAAIVNGVDSWLAEPSATRPAHLIVNLSVGWDSGQGYGGEMASAPNNILRVASMAPASRSVHAAITHAVCRGALVVVAAGNQSTPGSSGPMYPAQWETEAAPSAATCASFEGTATLPADPSNVTYQPLLHSVGGLDEVDAPLSNTRPLGRPRLAAYGLDVVTNDPRAVHTDMLSGTSMAAANVAGIAAAVWGYLPSATANQVMQLIYDNGVALTAAADFSLESAAPTIHRAALCDTLKAAVHGSFACNTPAAFVGSAPGLNWASLDPGFGATPVFATLLSSAASLPPSVGGVSVPWITSQPGSPTCTTCVVKAPRAAFIGTNPPPAPFSASDAFVTLTTKVGATNVTEYYRFSPPAGSATNGTNYAITLDPSSTVTGTVVSASITWNVVGGGTAYQTTAPFGLAP